MRTHFFSFLIRTHLMNRVDSNGANWYYIINKTQNISLTLKKKTPLTTKTKLPSLRAYSSRHKERERLTHSLFFFISLSLSIFPGKENNQNALYLLPLSENREVKWSSISTRDSVSYRSASDQSHLYSRSLAARSPSSTTLFRNSNSLSRKASCDEAFTMRETRTELWILVTSSLSRSSPSDRGTTL